MAELGFGKDMAELGQEKDRHIVERGYGKDILLTLAVGKARD